jgi:NAD(P)H-hydrate epimerase
MSLPDWLEWLPDAQRMRETDAWAIGERGIPSLQLMERAGEGLAQVIAATAPSGRVAIVCGKGNNGGDGFVAARLLHAAGRDVAVLALGALDALSPDAAEMARRLPGRPPVPFALEHLEGAAAGVDAILGTGATGAPRGAVAEAIEALNAAGVPVVAADVPSGVDASTGEAAGLAVRAAATATFHRAKPGLWIHPGKAHAGEVHVIDIGIPSGTTRPGAPESPQAGLLGSAVLDQIPRRGPRSTKFSSGNVFVVGGSRGLTGAPCLTAMAAARTGAGYVTVAAPGSLELPFAVRLLEAMMRPLPEDDGALSPDALEPALAAIERADALVLGPGLSKRAGAQALARALAERVEVALVIDADGLNALAGHLDEVLARRRGPTILTPHAGELGRLLEIDHELVEARRLHHVRSAAARTGAVVVLKGDDTLVAAPDGQVAVSPGRAPGLATAGTGDVLAGVAGALLAKGMEVRHAACAAVFAHLRAGQIAAAAHGPDGVIASDVIAALPAALAPVPAPAHTARPRALG